MRHIFIERAKEGGEMRQTEIQTVNVHNMLEPNMLNTPIHPPYTAHTPTTSGPHYTVFKFSVVVFMGVCVSVSDLYRANRSTIFRFSLPPFLISFFFLFCNND